MYSFSAEMGKGPTGTIVIRWEYKMGKQHCQYLVGQNGKTALPVLGDLGSAAAPARLLYYWNGE